MRLLAFPIAVVLLAGCQSSQPTNPFMSTTVPPPGTGQAALPNPQPYYPTGPGAPAAAPLQTLPPASNPTAPPAGNKFSPPGGFNYPQSSLDRSKAVNPVDPASTEIRAGGTALARRPTPARGSDPGTSTPATTSTLVSNAAQPSAAPSQPATSPSAPATASRVVLASFHDTSATDSASSGSDSDIAGGGKTAIRIAEPRTPPTGDEHTDPPDQTADSRASPPLRLTSTDTVTDIDDLPKALPQGSQARPMAGGQRGTYASYSQPVTPTLASRTAVGSNGGPPPTNGSTQPAVSDSSAQPATASRYAQGADYASLSGRLEYSQSTQRWKLRYIPIDGQTDQYGGSVVLDGPALLASFNPGDFVTVQGAIAGKGADGRSFAPTYELRNIEPQK